MCHVCRYFQPDLPQQSVGKLKYPAISMPVLSPAKCKGIPRHLLTPAKCWEISPNPTYAQPEWRKRGKMHLIIVSYICLLKSKNTVPKKIH